MGPSGRSGTRIVTYLLMATTLPALVLAALTPAIALVPISLILFVAAWRLLKSPARTFWLAPGLAALACVVVAVPGVYLYREFSRLARFSGDQGTIAAMRMAIAIYYEKHASYPDHPGNYVNPSPPPFQCPALTYTYSATTGEIRITSANSVDDCR
ncbi:MAG: hypothetical protein HYV62_08615 [Candidatus Rokubacteria bacterium]|nr:hypothetical protein [Candidatus Rokubacteria bacterium]